MTGITIEDRILEFFSKSLVFLLFSNFSIFFFLLIFNFLVNSWILFLLIQDPDISYDVNEGDYDPFPRYELSGKS